MKYNDNEQTTYERNLLMSFRLRQIPADDKLNHHLVLHALQECYPAETIGCMLSECENWEQRERALNMPTIISLIMALSLFPSCNVVEVLRTIAAGLLYVWPQAEAQIPTKGAISTRRKQLQVLPMRLLFRRCCHPTHTRLFTS